MEIRNFFEKDWEEIKYIYKSGMETEIATFENELPDWGKFNSEHLEYCRFVAVESGKIIGWIALSLMNNKKYYSGVAEVSIYIHEGFRSRGVGRYLLKNVIIESGKFGLWTLQAKIIEDNVPSIKLHKKCGFRLVGIRENLGRDKKGIFKNVWLMERKVNIYGGE
jgi:phosphinothricin acetyltransferase